MESSRRSPPTIPWAYGTFFALFSHTPLGVPLYAGISTRASEGGNAGGNIPSDLAELIEMRPKLTKKVRKQCLGVWPCFKTQSSNILIKTLSLKFIGTFFNHRERVKMWF